MKKNAPDSNQKNKENIQSSSSAVKSSVNTVPQSPSSSRQIGRRPSTIRRQQAEEIPKPNWKSLSTGLELLFSDESVKKMWCFDKPKIIIIDMLHDLMKRLEIAKNFESMELNIIAEFHLYNLIFAKQTLFLDDFKAAVFLNIMWTLLITDNPDYKMLYANYTRATAQSFEEIVKRQTTVVNSTNNKQNQQKQQQQQLQQQQNLQAQIQQQQQQPNAGLTPMSTKNIVSFTFSEAQKKTITRDLDSFKKWILKHSFNDPPQSIKVFEAKQVQSIVDFAQNSYFANHALYNYCLNNKNKNEEIKIQLYVDRPLVIPPLSDALYMGQPKIEIPEDEEDLEAARANGQLGSAQSRDIEDSQEVHEKEQELDKVSGTDLSGQAKVDDPSGKTKIDGSNQKIAANKTAKDSEESEIRQIVEVKIKAVEEEFTQTIHKRSEEVNRQFEDIVNPKKKK